MKEGCRLARRSVARLHQFNTRLGFRRRQAPSLSGTAGGRLQSFLSALRQSWMPGTALMAAALAVAFSLAAPAQAAPGDECAGMASPADEIACLRNALAKSQAELDRNRSGAGSRPAEAPPGPAPAPAMLPRAAETSAPAPSPSPASQPAQAARPAAPASPPARDAAADLGAEQVAGNRVPLDQWPVLRATIVAMDTDREGLFTLDLDNGQQWKQVEMPSIQISFRKGRTYSVEISKSGFGGYRMDILEMKRKIVVRRLK
jgi:hypothetical protein